MARSRKRHKASKEGVAAMLIMFATLASFVFALQDCFKNPFPIPLGSAGGTLSVGHFDVHSSSIVASGFTTDNIMRQQTTPTFTPIIMMIQGPLNQYLWGKVIQMPNTNPMINVVSFSTDGSLIVGHSKNQDATLIYELLIVLNSKDGSTVSMRTYPCQYNLEKFRKNIIVDSS